MSNEKTTEHPTEQMEPENEYKYRKLVNNITGTNVPFNDVNRFETAAQLRVMIRDGLRVDMLTESEYKLMCEIYTEEILLKFEADADIPGIEESKLKFEKTCK